jgi:hypothetical protein
MLPLQLRQEFCTAHMRGTAIELRNKQNTGWAQRDPAELLRMTYPTADVQRALEAVSEANAGRPNPAIMSVNAASGRSIWHLCHRGLYLLGPAVRFVELPLN